jgi:NitT/TauT family transport system ATP-binding protein
MDKDLVHKPVSKLSGGQKRRVAIVRAMIKEADFYCLDEPLKGLDENTKLKVIEYIKKRTKNKTLLIISHDLELTKYFNANCVNLDLH